jgi:hypothetical protein
MIPERLPKAIRSTNRLNVGLVRISFALAFLVILVAGSFLIGDLLTGRVDDVELLALGAIVLGGSVPILAVMAAAMLDRLRRRRG